MALPRNFVADAAEVASPSVVNLVCKVNGKGGGISGSGFIYSKDGFVVTNAHVVDASSDGVILVTMWNGRKHQGAVHSLDKLSDIALVKLADVAGDEDLPVAALGTSGTLRHGEFVIALGSVPFLRHPSMPTHSHPLSLPLPQVSVAIAKLCHVWHRQRNGAPGVGTGHDTESHRVHSNRRKY